MKKIYRHNSSDLGFVFSCLFRSAIDISEFKKWIEYIINDTEIDDIPMYIFALYDINYPLPNLYEITKFVPKDDFNDKEKKALYGISYLRNKSKTTKEMSRKSALHLLKQHPEVFIKFKEQFPFITDIDKDAINL